MRNAARCCPTCLAVLWFLLSPTSVVADLWGLSSQGNGAPAPGTETNYNKVFRFDEQGNKLPNDIPTSAGAFFPTGIAVSPAGDIYVSAYGAQPQAILRFDGQTGASLGTFATDLGPAQLAFGPDGNLYVSEFFGTNVRVYDAHPGANFGTRLADAATGLTSAQGLAFAANGDLLVGDGFVQAEGQTARIVRVPNGTTTDDPQTWGFTEGAFGAPVAMLTQANGDVLVVDMLGNYVARVSDAGVPSVFAFINPPVAPPSTNFPSDITFDPNGNIVISVLGETNPPDNRGALWRYDLNGNIIDPDNDATPNEPIVSGIEPIAGIDYTPSPKTLVGDYNGDNTVNSADYAKWQADHGKFVARGNGADGNSNGVVDAADYVVWRKAAGSGSGAAATSIPEPVSLGMSLGSILCFWASRRAPRRRWD
jgi:hypothetical protein